MNYYKIQAKFLKLKRGYMKNIKTLLGLRIREIRKQNKTNRTLKSCPPNEVNSLLPSFPSVKTVSQRLLAI